METAPKWYILRGGHRIGPLDASQLKYMATTEQLERSDLVWKEGMAQWVAAQQVKGLFDDGAPALTPATPPAPPAQPDRARAAAGTAGTIAPATPGTPTAHPAAPAYAARVSPRASKGTPLVWIPILGAIIILLTIVIPWFTGPEYPYGPTKIAMSWNLIGISFESGIPRQFRAGIKSISEFRAAYRGKSIVGIGIIAAWASALLVLILAPPLRGAARAGVVLALGIAALVFCLLLLFAGGLAFSICMVLLLLGALLIIAGGIALLANHLRRLSRLTPTAAPISAAPNPTPATAAATPSTPPKPTTLAPPRAAPTAPANPTTTAPKPAPAPPPPAGEPIEQKFAKLDQLRQAGIISDQEYQQKRQQLLGEI